MAGSAELKVIRAEAHLAELERCLSTTKPFTYVVGTDYEARSRFLAARKDAFAAEQASIICGDIVHNLRGALDHVYWDRVSPMVQTDRERRQVQFPFCQDGGRLPELLKSKFAVRVSPTFVTAIQELAPFKGPNGNPELCLIDELDILDKHKLLIPFGEYKTISSSEIRKQVPDFPFQISNMTLGMNQIDVMWQHNSPLITVGRNLGVVEQPIDVEIEIVFATSFEGASQPVIPTLRTLIATAKDAVDKVRNA